MNFRVLEFRLEPFQWTGIYFKRLKTISTLTYIAKETVLVGQLNEASFMFMFKEYSNGVD